MCVSNCVSNLDGDVLRICMKAADGESPGCLQEHGLRDLPTMTYPEARGGPGAGGVTLCCTRVQEAVGYVYYKDAGDGLERLKDLCSAIPVHCVFGDRPDIMCGHNFCLMTWTVLLPY